MSLTLTERQPATWAALADGALGWPRVRALALELGWADRRATPSRARLPRWRSQS